MSIFSPLRERRRCAIYQRWSCVCNHNHNHTDIPAPCHLLFSGGFIYLNTLEGVPVTVTTPAFLEESPYSVTHAVPLYEFRFPFAGVVGGVAVAT